MNGCAIKPPLYSRKVGRPTRNRRKAVEEVPARQGGKRISRHGIVIICSHCGLAGHNKRGCNDFKAGLPPYEKEQEQNTRRKRATSSVQEEPETVITQEQEEAMEEPVITQEHNMEDAVPFGAQYEHTMLHSMMSQTPMPKVVNAQPSPLPDSSFIATAREALVKAGPGPSTATKEGNLALKVAAMKHAKVQVSAARNSATLEARYESHEKQVADILAQREEKERQKKAAALAKKEEAARQKAIIAKQKREEALAKKAVQVEEKKAAAAAKRTQQEHDKKMAAQEKKAAAQARQEAAAAARAATVMQREQVQAAKKQKKESMFDIFK